MKLNKFLIAATGAVVFAAVSLAPARATAMPIGLPAAAIDEMDLTQSVALCFYIDGWNGPGLYQCGYRLRRGYGWHGHRGGGGRVVIRGGGGGRHMHGGGGHRGGGGGGKGHR